jgi:hypothetical protein
VGKTPEKLRLMILVDPEWLDHPKITELRDKGHTILPVETLQPPHLILSKSAHAWNDDMWPLLDVTMKAARARKKGLPTGDSQD